MATDGFVLAGARDADSVSDGAGDAWIFLPDSGGTLVEVPGTVVDGAFLGRIDRD